MKSLLLTLSLFLYASLNAQITVYPYMEDFEGGAAGWVVNGTGTWELGAPTAPIINSAASGTNAWVTNLTGLYNNSENASVDSPVFDFTAVPNPAIQFSFCMIVSLAGMEWFYNLLLMAGYHGKMLDFKGRQIGITIIQ